MTNTEYILKCCPFCGQDKLYKWSFGEDDRSLEMGLRITKTPFEHASSQYHIVQCRRCFATGPSADSEIDAAGRWNMRIRK